MLPPKKTVSPQQRELVGLFTALNESDRGSLLAFAQFLSQRSGVSSGAEQSLEPLSVTTPLSIPRPDNETVVAAIRRLSQTYPMLNKDELLHESSSLMTAHIMRGRAANEVIDDLEDLFSKAYKQYSVADSE